jgi:hypothetical protein
MARFTHKKKISFVAVAIVLVSGGAAFAYWTNLGSGTGTAATGANAAITISQSGSSAVLQPGGPSSTLSGTFTNPNTSPVFVNTLTATLASVTGSVGTPACTIADYELETASVTIGAQVAVDDTTAWSGIKVRMLNSSTNQDACKNATVNLAYFSN